MLLENSVPKSINDVLGSQRCSGNTKNKYEKYERIQRKIV